MPERSQIGFIYNPKVSEALGFVSSLVKLLDVMGNSWIAPASKIEVDENTLGKTKLIVTAGGDGTILRTVQVAAPHGVPIVGVNMGRVGFMTELTVEDAPERILDYVEGKHRLEARMMIRACLNKQNDACVDMEVHALNDIVVSRAAVPQLIDIEVAVDGAHLTTYRADGVILATATGSTGYAMSAGGPIMFPETRAIMIQPLAAHMSLQCGLVTLEHSVIELSIAEGQTAVLSVDAFADTGLESGDTVLVQASPYKALFLRANPSTYFYKTLTERLAIKEDTSR